MAHLAKFRALTSEEKLQLTLKLATKARRTIKALIRYCYANKFWLEIDKCEELNENVANEISVILCKNKEKSSVNPQKRTLLLKAVRNRKKNDMDLLYGYVGGLKCFRKYPRHVKMGLAGVSFYVYYNPNRMIIRQGDSVYASYYILFGEVHVTQIVFDKILNAYITNDLGLMSRGDMFGQYSLLHNIPAVFTVETKTDCELLVLNRDDFNKVLKDTVMADWEEIKLALRYFQYFNDWDDIRIKDCCILSKIVDYQTDEVIMGSKKTQNRFAYFILNGKCEVFEHLKLKVTEINGKKKHEIQEHDECWTRSESQDKLHELLNIPRPSTIRRVALPRHTKRINVGFGLKRKISQFEGFDLSSISSGLSLASFERSKLMTDSQLMAVKSKASVKTFTPRKISKFSKRFVVKEMYEDHFIRICQLNKLATFNIGENIANRFFVATEPTKCLLIPCYWLLPTDNIWKELKHFLDNLIPSTEEIFQQYLKNLKWEKFKKNLFHEALAKCKRNTGNSIHNVPYSIRMREDLKFLFH